MTGLIIPSAETFKGDKNGGRKTWKCLTVSLIGHEYYKTFKKNELSQNNLIIYNITYCSTV